MLEQRSEMGIKMSKTLITQITDCIEYILNMWGKKTDVVIYPCGDVGIQAISIMRNIYAIEPAYLIDNRKCRYTENIHDISFLKEINTKDCVLFFTSTNSAIYGELKSSIAEFFSEDRIVELASMKTAIEVQKYCNYQTKIGKYSYGALCHNNPWIAEIGAFCSFAEGVDYVTNHEMRYVTTHPIIYAGGHIEGYEYPYVLDRTAAHYMPGIRPKVEKIKKQKRAIIGNDVWLGKNVTITNSANIGNGVIAAAGAVITKDVPDYAIVAGVPARIIKYRYTKDQIDALNRIKWWDWTDDEIRERFDDFYLPIEQFIEKYGTEF